MGSIVDFKKTLINEHPDVTFAVQLKALWYDGKGNWTKAHALIDQLNDRQSAHVHAYLHRKEGDQFNAGYWYRKAGQIFPEQSLVEEWEELVLKFLSIK
ncbi:hypothetical protein G7074_21535 [Pedobacter sp. HDW13]|uniref:hypothetical protein n=1 Tax=unclassified Pedobacter TaxID=2628915 RepID=UPI000F5A5093|nr:MULTISPECIES: hypothetical protein [unclassified Pedobacter]QIL41617.1 hypothetical protein G7074_21535 [Pedobacter sp. HDW13]RQO64779.1 hypothetical protein DBR40_25040 [Pedobacter sp. KBW01]